MEKVGVGQQRAAITEELPDHIRADGYAVGFHQAGYLGTVHFSQRCLAPEIREHLLYAPLLIMDQLIRWISRECVLLLPQDRQVGRQSFTVPSHGRVEDNVDIGVAERSQSLGLVDGKAPTGR